VIGINLILAHAQVYGFAQVDTEQDASYHGIWANPFKLITISYVEGDVYTNTADNTQAIFPIKRKDDDHGYNNIR